MSLLDSDNFEKVLTNIESKSGVYGQLLNDIKTDTNNQSSGTSVRIPQQAQQIRNNESDMLKVLVSIDKKLGNISNEVSTLSDFITTIQSRNIVR